MPKKILIVLFLFLSNFLYAQEWTEPINISNMDGTDYYPDITVGPDGTLHCVWVHKFNTHHREIYYSGSDNEGNTWSKPISISQNDTLAVSSPHIVADKEDNLYVTYQYDSYYSPIAVIQTFDGNNWSKIDSVAEGYSRASRIFIDNNDRVYVYWLTGAYNMYYRYYENESWSDIICPFYGDTSNAINEGAVDSDNNLHFVGYYNNNLSYFKYNKTEEQMENPYILSYNNTYEGWGIAIDESNNPHIVWHDIQMYDHGTMYIRKSGPYWGTHTFIADSGYAQKITYCNNKPYIMDIEEVAEDSAITVLHQKDDYGQWYGYNILSTDGLRLEKLISNENKLIALYSLLYNDDQFDIYIIKTKQGVGVNEIENINSVFTLSQNYPNPFTDITTVSYQLNNKGKCVLNIFNIEGKIIQTLVNKDQLPGKYNVEWNGTNSKGKKLPSGIYLYRLSLDSFFITKTLIIN